MIAKPKEEKKNNDQIKFTQMLDILGREFGHSLFKQKAVTLN
jgi:hypothetical protein